MTASRDYDTVAFDARDNTELLFFARTAEDGNIEDYLLLMRPAGADFSDAVYVEINDQLYSGDDVIVEARMAGNVMTLKFSEAVASLDGDTELVMVFSDTAENRAAIEMGAFRLLGDKLAGGNA
jgi:hypothetical protein